MKRRCQLILNRNVIRHLNVERLARIAAAGCPTDSLTTEQPQPTSDRCN